MLTSPVIHMSLKRSSSGGVILGPPVGTEVLMRVVSLTTAFRSCTWASAALPASGDDGGGNDGGELRAEPALDVGALVQ